MSSDPPVPSASLEQRLTEAAREFRLQPQCRLMLEAADALAAQREDLRDVTA